MNETLLFAKDALLTSNPILTNIIIAIIIFIIGLILGGILGKVVERILKDFKLDPTLKKKTGLKTSIENLLSGFVQVSIYIIFTVIALNYVGITSLLLNILFIVIIVVLAISFLLALKDSLPNITAGRIIRRKNLIYLGCRIKVENIEGEIKEMSMFEIKVEQANGDILHIPNSVFIKESYVVKK